MTNPARHRHSAAGILKSGCAILALLAAQPGFAQEETAAADDGVYRLGTIFLKSVGSSDDDENEVVATEISGGGKVATAILDTPASVSVITAKEMRDRNAQTVEQVLQYSAAVHSDYYGSDDRNDYYLIRGYQATTYRDGLTLGSMRGVREEPLAYERVEVLRGTNSTLFGVGDPGGSVNFVTKTAKFDRIANTALSFGSNGNKEASFDYNTALPGSETLAFRLTGKVKDGALDYDHSQDDETFLMAGVTWAPGDSTSLSLVADVLKREGTPNSGGYPLDREYDRSEFFGEPDYNFHDVDRTSVSALLTHEFDNGLSLHSNLRYSDLTDNFGYVYLYDFAGRTGTDVSRYYFGTDYSAEEVIGNVILQYDTMLGQIASSTLAGLEFRDASTTSKSAYGLASSIDIANPVFSGAPTAFSVYDHSQIDYRTKSLFVTQNFSFDERLIASVGLRRDFLDITNTNLLSATPTTTKGSFAETSGRFALTYKVTDEISVYGSYVESVAPPTIGVEPERGEQFELGAKYAPEGSSTLYSVAVYDLTKKDVTIPVVLDTGVIERQKVGETGVKGLDLEARTEVNDQLTLMAAYSYMETEIVAGALWDGTSMAGKEFTSAPRHTAAVWANYTLPEATAGGDVRLGLGLRYVGSYYLDAQNTKKSDDALLVDASVGFELGDMAALELNVSNLFDEQHVVGSATADYYNPGRSIGVTLRKAW